MDSRLRAARELAWAQDGLLMTSQLRDQDLGDRRQLLRLVQRGLLIRVHKGVYKLPDAARTPIQAWRAALMRQNDAALSHWTAASYWKLPGLERAHVHLTLRKEVTLESVVVHRHTLWPGDVVERQGLRVTSPERTLMDLAPLIDDEQLQVAIEAAWKRNLIRPEAFLRRLRDLPRQAQRDVRELPSLLLQSMRRGAPLKSPFEVRCWRMMREAGIAPPAVQARFWDHEGEMRTDFFWEQARLVLEAQGRAYHMTADGFERSARRSQRLRALGISMMVVTWAQIEQEPLAVAERIHRALAVGTQPAPREPLIYDSEPVPPSVLSLLDAA